MNTSTIFCYPQQVNFRSQSSPEISNDIHNGTVKIDNTLVKLSLDNYQAYYLTFAGMKDPQGYNSSYEYGFGHNGMEADTFVLDQIDRAFSTVTDKSLVSILDIGAGDGRNSIAIAKKGYKLTALETSNVGRDLIIDEATKAGVSDLIRVSKADLLKVDDTKLPEKKYDFVLMSHVSQHFTEEDFQVMMKNIAKMLKPGGKVVFDVLFKQDNFIMPEITLDPEEDGFCSFEEKQVLEIAANNGLQLVIKPVDYNEPDEVRADFVDSGLWGREPGEDFWSDEDPIFSAIPVIGDPEPKLNVDLKWVMLSK